MPPHPPVTAMPQISRRVRTEREPLATKTESFSLALSLSRSLHHVCLSVFFVCPSVSVSLLSVCLCVCVSLFCVCLSSFSLALSLSRSLSVSLSLSLCASLSMSLSAPPASPFRSLSRTLPPLSLCVFACVSIRTIHECWLSVSVCTWTSENNLSCHRRT